MSVLFRLSKSARFEGESRAGSGSLFLELTRHISSRHVTSLYTCARIQGVRRAEQNTLLDIFLARTSTATGLSDDSFLTSLDMDPLNSSTGSANGTNGFNSPTVGGSGSGSGSGGGAGGGTGGLQSPMLGGGTSGLFSSLPMLPNSSADGLGLSRSGTPLGQLTGGGGGDQKGKEALNELRRFGARFGAASRLFGGGGGGGGHGDRTA